jgi:hypothetical protein
MTTSDGATVDQGLHLVNGDRQADYGEPVNNMRNIALAWSAIVGFEVKARHVPLMLAAMKLVREGHKHKDDNLTDAQGYIEIADRVAKSGHYT